MKMHNAANERIKRDYFTYLKEAKRYSEASLDGVAKALHRFETYTKFRDFKAFHFKQAVAFKARLAEQQSARTGDRLSKATLYSTLNALKNFFIWLAGQPGYRSRLKYSDAEYFNLSDKEMRIAKAHREQLVPTLEQVKLAIDAMPAKSDIEKRDRAVIAFILLTGARDGAVVSLMLKHIDLAEGKVDQDARDVLTKFSKSFPTYFFPVGDDVLKILVDWIAYLKNEKHWSLDDPLFPATRVALGESGRLQVCGLDRAHWSGASSIRAIFRRAFAQVGLPYFIPHSLRKTLVRLGEEICQTPEEFKAWSQNLGHEKVMTTFTSYGAVTTRRQAQIIRDLANEKTVVHVADETTLKAIQVLRQAGMLTASR